MCIRDSFHPTLVPDEVSRYAEAVVTGEAETVWANVVDDLRHHTLKKRYHGERAGLSAIKVDRTLFRNKRYLPIGLVETGRGCRFPCEFCAIQDVYKRQALPNPQAFDSRNFLTQAVFEATRSCAHDCEFCVAPTCLLYTSRCV